MLLTRFLNIQDIKVREYLGLPVHEEAMMTDAKLRILLKGALPKLKETVPKMYKENVKRLAELAVELEIESLPKINYLKEQSGIDIYKAIQMKKENEESPVVKSG